MRAARRRTARYGRFLKMQYLFHGDLDALFFNPALEALLPDLAARRRLLLVEEDLRDIGSSIPNACEFMLNRDLRGCPS
ncbi:hypothetical protein [Neorhizobium galegae]|uniref:hypothetical protein n=1 Tax=Neorhizobium galegae TaxID=399 RepID=UPI001F2F4086|nr:hypothetical protein [Neorhizobium galegae]UIK08111.1 hypothetical protein LZK81_27275 [Neorhizobium galegae]